MDVGLAHVYRVAAASKLSEALARPDHRPIVSQDGALCTTRARSSITRAERPHAVEAVVEVWGGGCVGGEVQRGGWVRSSSSPEGGGRDSRQDTLMMDESAAGQSHLAVLIPCPEH